MWPDLAKFRHFGKILKVFGKHLKALFTIWQNFEPTLANILCYATNLYPYKWPNIEKQSSHLVTLKVKRHLCAWPWVIWVRLRRAHYQMCVTVWSDVAKFYHFCKIIKVFGKCLWVIWYLAKHWPCFGTF